MRRCYFVIVFFFKQKTAYEMRISDWSSDVCSSDLTGCGAVPYAGGTAGRKPVDRKGSGSRGVRNLHQSGSPLRAFVQDCLGWGIIALHPGPEGRAGRRRRGGYEVLRRNLPWRGGVGGWRPLKREVRRAGEGGVASESARCVRNAET